MSCGTFYLVADDARHVLLDRVTKGDWYEAIGTLLNAQTPSIEAEDSISAWAISLAAAPSPLDRLFVGELSARRDEFDDPDVAFLGSALLAAVSAALNECGEAFIRDRLAQHGAEHHTWLYQPLRQFLQVAVRSNHAMIILWGR